MLAEDKSLGWSRAKASDDLAHLRFVVVVCTRNLSSELLDASLTCISRQDWPSDSGLLVVANESPGDSDRLKIDFAKGGPVGSWFAFADRIGYASVRNRALELVRQVGAAAFVDDDTLMETGWVGCMFSAHQNNPNSLLGSLHSRVLNLPRDQDAIDAEAKNSRQAGTLSLSGSNGLLIPRVHMDASYFDERYNFSGGEDTDYLLRMSLLGHQVQPVSCVLLEEDRNLTEGWFVDFRESFAKGKLWIRVNRNLGQSTAIKRFRAAIGLIPSSFFLLVSAVEPRQRKRQRLRSLAVRLGVLFAWSDQVKS